MKVFKRILISLLALVLLALPMLSTIKVKALGSNLLTNPSVETTNAGNTAPQNWQTGSWGTNNASFSYENTGYTGTRSVKTTISSYTSGDAKWFFTPVTVSANTSYTFSTYYQSNVSTDIIAQLTDTTGGISYVYLTSTPASATWKQVSTTLTTGANTSKVTIFHVLGAAGYLQTDEDFFGPTVGASDVAPTVNITSPINGTTVSNTVTVTANAASNGASVAGVQFKVNGTNAGNEITTAPYSYAWNTTSLPNGPYTITAVVRSTNGLTATSNPVNVTVSNSSVPVDGSNIVANPSFETTDPANAAKPANWQSNSWGTNTANFSYNNTGLTGSKSVTTNVTAYTSGDAKWVPDAQPVTGGKSYLYSDFYKSNVATRVFIGFTDANGATTFQEVSPAVAATNWTQYQENFYAPTTAVKASVFHLLDKVGSLTVDDVSLKTVTVNTNDTVVPNGSVELGTTNPTGWTKSNWGNNKPTYQYVTNDGFTGTKSVKVTMANYVDGDAKWFFNPITNLTPGKQYRLTAYYKTNVTPKVVGMFNMQDGTTKFFGMPNAFPPAGASTQWQKYTDTFMVPVGAVSVSAFMFINQNGWLQTDAYAITDYAPTGFSKPLLTMTFDDGEEENGTTALPLLNQYGFKTTQCYATTFIKGNQDAINEVLAFKNAGHEICSHTVTHPFLTQLTTAAADKELKDSQTYLESITGQKIVDFASPYGDYNPSVNTLIAKYYQAHRTVDEGYNSKDNFNPYRLRVQNMQITTPPSQVAAWIAQAKATNTWLILVFHRVSDTEPEQFDTRIADFKADLEAIKNSGIAVKTFKDALAETKAQL